mmetsp:Transcript_20679/g.46909  ORF Transcript_20679/g.46909 Transcript_20679/m.46909 type:complete len:88 (-) Transcript_20679:1300-1563(-)
MTCNNTCKNAFNSEMSLSMQEKLTLRCIGGSASFYSLDTARGQNMGVVIRAAKAKENVDALEAYGGPLPVPPPYSVPNGSGGRGAPP